MTTTEPKAKPIKGLDAMQARDMRWYLPEHEETRAQKMTAVARSIRRADEPRQDNYRRYWSLYSNLPMQGLSPRGYAQSRSGASRERLALNVVRSCSDSFVAKLTNERPRVSCITTEGDWDMQQRAEGLETFLDGQFYETELYESSPLIALDMAIGGTGTVKIYSDGEGENERVCIERVKPWETAVDDEAAYDGKPRERYQWCYVDRLVAISMFAADNEELARKLATVARDTEGPLEAAGVDAKFTDTICIVEAWHLPSVKGGADGRHTIACGDIKILDEPWDKDYFPFVDLYRQRPQCGIWGTGLAEELQGLQFEINVILNMIRKAMRMSGTLRWWVENGSNVNTQYISDIIGSIGRYSGTMPTPMVPPAVAPEVYQQLVFLYGKAFEISGISQLSATSMAPGFEESGKAKALRLDTESERFSVAFGLYQMFFLKIARQVIALAKEIGDRNPQFQVKAAGQGNLMQIVKWADVHLEESEYVLQMAPSNAFARSPSAKLQQIQDFANAGVIDPKTARRLIGGIPDLAEEDSYENASYDLTMKMVMDMLKRGEFQPPEPFMDLQDAIKRMQMAYLKARRSKVPEPHLELLRRWIQMATDMVNPPAPPTPPMPAAAPPPPDASPATPPMAA